MRIEGDSGLGISEGHGGLPEGVPCGFEQVPSDGFPGGISDGDGGTQI